jgi:hypothetical protein
MPDSAVAGPKHTANVTWMMDRKLAL